MKKGIDLPYTNWSGIEITLLISPKQDENSKHKGMKCGMISWVL